MDQILTNLKDPSWWFTAFFIAIIASVIAGFAKDRIGSFAARLSTTMRSRLEKKSVSRNARIEELATNDTLLILSFIHAGVTSIFSFQVFILFLLSPMWVEVSQNWCSAASFDPTCRWDPKPLAIGASFLFGILSIFSSYKSSSSLSISSKAITAYRRRNGLTTKKD